MSLDQAIDDAAVLLRTLPHELRQLRERLAAAKTENEQLREQAKQLFCDPAFAKALVEWAGDGALKVAQAKIEQLQKLEGTDDSENRCDRCGGRNLHCWSADSDLWNRVRGEYSILCPICFAELAAAAGVKPALWQLRLEGDDPEISKLRLRLHNHLKQLAEDHVKIKGLQSDLDAVQLRIKGGKKLHDVQKEKIDRLQEENEMLCAALGTPEVYAGVITKEVEREKDLMFVENKKLRLRLHNHLKQLAENYDEAEQLRAKCDASRAARDRFCSAVNEIANVMGHVDKQCYAPEAVVRWVKRLCAKTKRQQEENSEIWDEVVQTCKQAWPDQTDLVWNGSPIELIVRLIDERDGLRQTVEAVDRRHREVRDAIAGERDELRLQRFNVRVEQDNKQGECYTVQCHGQDDALLVAFALGGRWQRGESVETDAGGMLELAKTYCEIVDVYEVAESAAIIRKEYAGLQYEADPCLACVLKSACGDRDDEVCLADVKAAAGKEGRVMKLYEVSAKIDAHAAMSVLDSVRDGKVDLSEWSILQAEKMEQAARLIREYCKTANAELQAAKARE